MDDYKNKPSHSPAVRRTQVPRKSASDAGRFARQRSTRQHLILFQIKVPGLTKIEVFYRNIRSWFCSLYHASTGVWLHFFIWQCICPSANWLADQSSSVACFSNKSFVSVSGECIISSKGAHHSSRPVCSDVVLLRRFSGVNGIAGVFEMRCQRRWQFAQKKVERPACLIL